jgi:hypothetical protein
VLLGVNPQHELDQSPVQPRDRSLHHHEACPGKLDGRIEVEAAEPRADIRMVSRREVELRDRAPSSDFLVVALVQAPRHRLVGHIGDRTQKG